MSKPCIVAVVSDDEERRDISAWLQDAGYDDVMFCPGPGEPDYTCLGGRGAPCPLSKAADVVIVDMRLRSDEVLRGTPGWQLMLYYYEQGKQIVAISGVDDVVHPWPDDHVHVVHRPLQPEPLVAAVGSFAPLVSIGGA